MNERIKTLADLTVAGKMWVEPVKTEYDREDLFLSPVSMSAKRINEYVLNQEPLVLPQSAFTGLLKFDGSVEGDIFNRSGHKNFAVAMQYFYNKPVDNLLTFEWQHATGDFKKIITGGIIKIQNDIETSMKNHANDKNAVEFLKSQELMCNTIIGWAHKCSKRASECFEKTDNPEYRKNLLRLSEVLKKIPEHPAENFYEAVLSVYICYSFIPDSIGLIDRYLYPYYEKDIQNGTITKDIAKEYLQELFLMLQARISVKYDRFYRGGESHFCIGGYLQNGEDGFSDLSKLIVEGLMELPTWIPQISLRWTKKTPREVLKFMLDCERHDPNKRIAFVNDEPRLKGLTEHAGFSYEEAINYTMLGCNELSVPGGIVFGFDAANIVRSLANTFHKRTDDILKADTFEEFYKIYEEELFSDLWEINRIGKGLQNIRSRDCNIVSNIFFDGCIENAKSVTQGGITKYTAVGLLIGISTVIDSLSITKQFIFDEKRIDMKTLTDALISNWNGYEDLHAQISKYGNFFGNDDECSNSIANMFFESLNKWNNCDNYLKKKWIFGNLIGYNEHHKFFGTNTPATPDGRFCGDMISFGIGQNNGRDRMGLTSLLNSIAKCDPYAIMTGPSVTNIMIEESLIQNDDNFEMLVYLFETYFKNGGTHFQLTYVSKEDLIAAKSDPQKHKNLRVRVSGFSDYFVFLNEALQDEIITRTKQNNY